MKTWVLFGNGFYPARVVEGKVIFSRGQFWEHAFQKCRWGKGTIVYDLNHPTLHPLTKSEAKKIPVADHKAKFSTGWEEES